MALKMAENSLFAILLRAPWWVGWMVTAGVFGVARILLPKAYIDAALFAALPFGVIAVIGTWRRFNSPSSARVEAALERVRAMPWETFAMALEAGWQREGYAVARAEGAADFVLEKNGRVSLAAAKRWKAARTGAEPLRELHAAGEAREAGECLYVCAGDITDTARGLAAEKNIRLVEGLALAKLAGVL